MRTAVASDDHGEPVLRFACRRFIDAVTPIDAYRNGACVLLIVPGDLGASRRVIDFCSGAVYATSGGFERVGPGRFLLTPEGRHVSPEQRAALEV